MPCTTLLIDARFPFFPIYVPNPANLPGAGEIHDRTDDSKHEEVDQSIKQLRV